MGRFHPVSIRYFVPVEMGGVVGCDDVDMEIDARTRAAHDETDPRFSNHLHKVLSRYPRDVPGDR
jgi:hypothetical protein